MSSLLEILGRAITIDTADLIWHWLNAVKPPKDLSDSAQYQQLNKAVVLMGEAKLDAAQEQLRLYLFENPACVRGRLAAAAVCLRNNQLQEAIEELIVGIGLDKKAIGIDSARVSKGLIDSLSGKLPKVKRKK